MGSPTGINLLVALATPDSLGVLPGAGFNATGTYGGPFTPNSQVFSLTNSGGTSLTWSLINPASWLTPSSTGGTLATWLAGQPAFRDEVAAVVLVSPNYALRDRRARMLLWPWGRLIARIVAGKERCFRAANPEQARHWTLCYPTNALLPMMALVETVDTMAMTGVTAPVMAAYSPEDRVVDETETARVIDRMGSKTKRTLLVRGSDDAEQHVVTGDIMSPSTTDTVLAAAVAFVRDASPTAAEGAAQRAAGGGR